MMRKTIDAKTFQDLLDGICGRFARDHRTALKNHEVGVVGIHTRGVFLARRAAEILGRVAREVEVGSLDITLYRDDVGEIGSQPLVKETDIPFPVEGKTILLFDDVLYSGRTIRAALDALLELGRPRIIRLAVMVDRAGRELPIQADYVGTQLKVGAKEKVHLKVKELDKEDGVWLGAPKK